MLIMQDMMGKKSEVVVERARVSDIPAIASLFIECFQESVLHHCGGRLPKPQAMQDVFTLVYQAEPEAALLARIGGKCVGYCFAPANLSRLWIKALLDGHLIKWTWRWLTGQYGFGLHPIKIIIMNKVAFLRSAITPTKGANARILSIAVAPKVRGMGIASRLMEEAVQYFTDCQAQRVRLEVRPENAAAIRVYEKWGFVEQGYTVDSQGKWLIMFREMEHHDV